jgi:hypothetical protein
MTVDHAKVRASLVCPLCEGPKHHGLLTCWPCNREYGLSHGNKTAEAKIDAAEERLAKTSS